MSTIKVRLKDASGNVLHPETDWSVVQNKPSIETYPGTAGACIGEISGFRVYYSEGTFVIYVTHYIESGNYTLGFVTPGAILAGEKSLFAFFINILDLVIKVNDIVDENFVRPTIESGDIDQTSSTAALGFLGDRTSSLEKAIAAQDYTALSLNVDNSGTNEYVPIDYLGGGSGELFLTSFTLDEFTTPEENPIFISVAKKN